MSSSNGYRSTLLAIGIFGLLLSLVLLGIGAATLQADPSNFYTVDPLRGWREISFGFLSGLIGSFAILLWLTVSALTVRPMTTQPTAQLAPGETQLDRVLREQAAQLDAE